MAGFDNDVGNWIGERLEPSTAQAIGIAQQTNSVSKLNISGSPEGVVAANPASLAHDRSSGNIYQKVTGTGNTGWKLITNAGTDLYESPYIVDAAGGAGSSYTTIQAAVTQAIADGATSVARNILIRPGTYAETFSITTANVKLNFIGIGGTYLVSNTAIPRLNGTLTINASLSNISFSNMQVTTLTLSNCLICTASGAYFDTVTRSSGSFYANATRLGVSYSQSNSDVAQFTNCIGLGTVSGSAGSISFYGGTCSLLSLSGTLSVAGYNCYFSSTSGTSSNGLSLAGCSGSVQFLNASPIGQGISQQGNFIVSRAISSSGSSSINDYLLEVDSSGGAVTITVPIGTNVKGYSFIVKDVGGAAASNNITITPSGKTIDGVASKVISSAYGSLTIYYNGTNFFTL